MTVRQICNVVVLVCLFIGSASLAQAQEDEFSPGLPPQAATIPVELGSVDLATGNLHIEIPLSTLSQRGHLQLNERLVYDSSIWHGVNNSTTNGPQWEPTNVMAPSGSNSWGGWRFVDGPVIDATNYGTVFGSSSCSSDGYEQFQNFVFTDSQGTQHTFPIYTIAIINPTPGCVDSAHPDTPTAKGYATDGSGMYGVVSGYSNLTVYDAQGTEVYGFGGGVQDRNGNFWSGGAGVDDLVDDLDRTPVQTTQTSNGYTYSVLAEGGKRLTYTLTLETISLNTNFIAQSVGNDFQGSIQVVQSLTLPDGTSYQFGYTPNYGELSSITLPQGGTVTYQYTGGKNGTRAGENVPPMWVSSRTGADGTTNFSIIPSNCQNTGHPCQQQDNTMTRNGNDTDYTFTLDLNGSYFNTKTVAYSGAASGSAALVEVDKAYDETTACPASLCSGYIDRALTSVVTSWKDINQSTAQGFVYGVQGGATPTKIQQWDFYSGAQPVTPNRETDVALSHTFANGLLLPGTITQYNASHTQVAQTIFVYDEAAYLSTTPSNAPRHTPISGTNGDLTTISKWLDRGNTAVEQHTTYDDAGSVLNTYDQNQNMTSYAYDPTDTFPIKTTLPPTNGVSHIVQATFDGSTGLPLTSEDLNSQTTIYGYDSLGRLGSIATQRGALQTYTYPSAVETDIVSSQSSTVNTSSSVVVDTYGRHSSQTVDGITTSVSYDSSGRLGCRITAHVSSSSTTDGSTCYQYDALNRVNQITRPDGNLVTAQYTGNSVTITDELKHQRKRVYDGFRDILEVDEPDSTGALNWPTLYTFDGLGRLTGISQHGNASSSAGWRNRSFYFDSLSRMYQETTPEAGTKTYGFDNNGNLTSVTDARGASTGGVTYTYDALNRPLTKTVAGASAYTYVYDAADASGDPFGNGRLTSVSSGTTVGALYTHDADGNLASTKFCTPSDCSFTKAMQAVYDFHGNVTSLTYPDGRNLGLTYDQDDRQTGEMYASWNGQAVNIPYVSNMTYFPTGQLQAATLGNSVQLSTNFNSRQDITLLQYAQGTTNISSRSYSWDLNAKNLLKISDSVRGTTRTFTYDPTDRISSVNDSGSGSGDGTDGSGQVTIGGQEQAVSKTICKTINGVRHCTPATVYDTGTVSVTAGGMTESVSYGGGSSPSSIAAALASAFNNSSSSGIYASTSSQSPGVLTLESTSSGTASDVSLSATSSTSDPSDFSSPSFTTSSSGSSLGGGSNNHPISMTFTPDAWGNLQQAGTFSFTQAFSVNNQISTGGYAYDGAGNQTADGLGNTYSYQGDGLLSASNGVAYVYDGAGQRVRKSGSSSNVEYYYFAGKLLAVQDVGTGQWTDYIYAAGRLIAESAGVQTAAPLYRLGDHLDSLTQTSDGSGHAVANNDFAPFGQQVNGDASSRILFTQHEQDTENSSVHALFRQLSPAQGRWLSPDPFTGSYDVTNPQSLNRYAYLLNSPMNAVDPFGLEDDTSACGNDSASDCSPGGTDGGDGDGGDSCADGCFDQYGNVYYGNDNGGITGGETTVTVNGDDNGGFDLIGFLFGGSGNSSGLISKIARTICSFIPSGRIVGVSGSAGPNVASGIAGAELVLNYGSGQTSVFGYAGLQGGVNGFAAASSYQGFAYGLYGDNSNYSGGFTSVSGGALVGGFVSRSSGGLSHGLPGLQPAALGTPGAVTSFGYSAGVGTASPTGNVGFTNYSNPVQAGKFTGFGAVDYAGYAAKNAACGAH